MATYDITQTVPAVTAIYTNDILICPYSGSIKSVTLPVGTYKLEAWGGAGGPTTYSQRGRGGYSYGTYTTSANTLIYCVSGGRGSAAETGDAAGGYNGGGKGHQQGLVTSGGQSMGGGGATHIATRSGLLSTLSSYTSNILLVAGGGGGGHYSSGDYSGYAVQGGYGGGTSGGDGVGGKVSAGSSYTLTTSKGATQSSGGAGASLYYGIVSATGDTGSFGLGGNSEDVGDDDNTRGCGGGGGGYYGGGGGGCSWSGLNGYGVCSSGAGGSGYVSSVLTSAATTQQTTSTNPDGSEQGYIKITVISSVNVKSVAGHPTYNYCNPSNFSLSNVSTESSSGLSGSYTFNSSCTAMLQQNGLPDPIAGHKYYGRCLQKAAAGFTFGDGRFEYYYTDGSTTNMTFFNAGSSTADGNYHLVSNICSLSSIGASGGWIFRSFVVNGTSTLYRAEQMIIDLTANFGKDCEPTKEWCDENIPYFTGTIYMDLSGSQYNLTCGSLVNLVQQERVGTTIDTKLTAGGAGTSTGTGYCVTGYIPLPSGCTNITINAGGTSTSASILHEYGVNYNYLSYWGMTENPRTFSLDYPSDTKYLRATFVTDNLDSCYIYDNTNGRYICRCDDNVLVDYNGNTIRSVIPGNTMTLATASTVASSNIGIGDKTFLCSGKVIPSNIVIASSAISRPETMDSPSTGSVLYCTGSAQSPTWTNYDSNKATIISGGSATNVGSYTANFLAKDNYIYLDGYPRKSVNWSILQGTPTISLSKSSMSIVGQGVTNSFTISTNSDGTKVVSSSATGVASVSLSGNTVTVTGQANGTATISVYTSATTNFTQSSTVTCIVTVSGATTYTWNKYYALYNYVETTVLASSSASNTVNNTFMNYGTTKPTWTNPTYQQGASTPSLVWTNYSTTKPTTSYKKSGTLTGYYMMSNSDSAKIQSQASMQSCTSTNYWIYSPAWDTNSSGIIFTMRIKGDIKGLTLGSPNLIQGSYISQVTSTDSSAYPDNGFQDGYWYVKQ